jgi:hypothetical protein
VQPDGDFFGLACSPFVAENLTSFFGEERCARSLRFDVMVVRLGFVRNLGLPDDLDAHLDATTHVREFVFESRLASRDITSELLLSHKRAESKWKWSCLAQNTAHDGGVRKRVVASDGNKVEFGFANKHCKVVDL